MSNVVLKGFQKRIIPQALDVPDSSIDRFFRNPKSEQFKQGFIDENAVALTFASKQEKTQKFKKDPKYNFLYDEQLKPYLDNIDYFRNSGSKLESKYLIEELKDNASLIGTNPGAYFIGRLTGGILDPVTYAAFSMKAFRTASGAYNLKKITAIAAAEELYKQTINANREKELAYFVPIGTAIVTGLVNTIGRLRSFEGGEAINKYNKQQLLLDGREEVVARTKLNNGELLDSRILDPNNRTGPKGVGADATNTGGVSAIYYPTDATGDTYLFNEYDINDKVEIDRFNHTWEPVDSVSPKKGRLITFPSNHYHAGSPTTSDRRMLININFFPK